MKNKQVLGRRKPITEYFDRDVLGDASFDLEVSRHRSSLFLQRNIRRLLRIHEQRIKATARAKGSQQKLTSSNGRPAFPISQSPAKISDQDTSVNDGDLRSFNMLSKDPLVAIYKPPFAKTKLLHPVLQLKIKSLSTQAPKTRGNDTYRGIRYSCLFSLSVFDSRSEGSASRPIFEDNRKGILLKRLHSNGDSDIVVDNLRPFEINSAVLEGRIWAGPSRWGEIAERYLIELRIVPLSKTPSDWPPMKLLVTGNAGRYRNLGLKHGALLTRFNGLSAALDTKAHHPVQYVDSDNNVLLTQLELHFGATWAASTRKPILPRTKPLGSILVPQPQSILHQNLNDHKTLGQTVYTFVSAEQHNVIPEKRTIEFLGQTCPFCCEAKMSFATQKELQFHLILSHDRQHFVLEQRPNQVAESSQSITSRFKVYTAKPGKQKVQSGENAYSYINWVAPKRPFDFDAYANGDYSWLGIGTRPREGAIDPSVTDPTTILRIQHGGFLPASHVKSIPKRPRRKYPVVPTRTRDGLSIFTSVTHRKLRRSESPLSESDDDVDEKWLRDKHAGQVAEMDHLTLEQRDFRIRWNDHRRAERFGHTAYLSDSLVRWVKKDLDWLLGDVERRRILVQFMSDLLARKIVNIRVIDDIHMMIFPTKTTKTTPTQTERFLNESSE